MMRASKVNILMLVLSLFSFNAKADQTFNLSESNNTIITSISKSEITRISFSDEVVSINALKGELEYEIQGKDVFLRTNVDKPINLFVKTKNEQVYKFIATVENIPPTQIFVRAETKNTNSGVDSFKDESELQKHKDVQIKIAKIIEVILHPKPYLGYLFIELDQYLWASNRNLSMRLIGRAEGNQLIAEKIKITNKSNEVQELYIKDLISPDTLAIYQSKAELQPGESSVLIKVIEN